MWAKGDRSNSSHGQDLYNFVMSQNIPGKETALHIFIPGNFGSPGDGGRACGFGCLEWSMLEDVYYRYQNGQKFWHSANVLVHEIGHNLGLHHVWQSNDRCDDTVGHLDGRFFYGSDNNLMNYSGNQRAVTDDQITRCHRYLYEHQYILEGAGYPVQVMNLQLSNSGNNGPVYTVTNTGSSSGRLTVQNLSGTTFTWTKYSGSGSFSSSSNGRTVDVSNLGSISMTSAWTDNCLPYCQNITLYNAPFFREAYDNDPLMGVKLGEIDYLVVPIDDEGNGVLEVAKAVFSIDLLDREQNVIQTYIVASATRGDFLSRGIQFLKIQCQQRS